MWVLILVLPSLAVFLLARLLFFKGPILPPEEAPTGVIDMHCHTAGIAGGEIGARVSDTLRESWRFPIYLKIFGSNAKELAVLGDERILDVIENGIRDSKHVRGAVVIAMDAPYDESGKIDEAALEVFVPNRFVGEAVKKRDTLYFGASVHPFRRDALEELEWSKANGAVLIKWLPNIQGIDPADRRLEGYYRKLVELDLPLLTHTGHEDSFSKTNNALGDPKRLEYPLSLGVRVIAAHVASSGKNEGQCNVERLLELMPRFPNLVADISTLTQFNRKKFLPKVLRDDRLRGRVIYGTDYPLTNTPMVSPWLYPLRLTLRQMWTLSRVRNSWDRDVRLKAALGVPREVFLDTGKYLGV